MCFKILWHKQQIIKHCSYMLNLTTFMCHSLLCSLVHFCEFVFLHTFSSNILTIHLSISIQSFMYCLHSHIPSFFNHSVKAPNWNLISSPHKTSHKWCNRSITFLLWSLPCELWVKFVMESQAWTPCKGRCASSVTVSSLSPPSSLTSFCCSSCR